VEKQQEKRRLWERFHLVQEGNSNQFLMVTADSTLFHIQNLYATYAATDKLSFTLGIWERLLICFSPWLTLFDLILFTNGPFQVAELN
jgi:hypothetical protein